MLSFFNILKSSLIRNEYILFKLYQELLFLILCTLIYFNLTIFILLYRATMMTLFRIVIIISFVVKDLPYRLCNFFSLSLNLLLHLCFIFNLASFPILYFMLWIRIFFLMNWILFLFVIGDKAKPLAIIRAMSITIRYIIELII